MKASLRDVWLTSPDQADIDWLIRQGASPVAMVQPLPMLIASGYAAADGRLEQAEGGERWLAFEEAEDFVFWQPRSNQFATYANRAFALGETAVCNPGTYAFDCALNIFANPLEWLTARRDGIVILDWSAAFDRLRDAPRIAITETLLPLYRRHMKPARMPELFVIPARRCAA